MRDKMLKGILLGIPEEISPVSIKSNIQWYLLTNLGINLISYDENDKIIPAASQSWEVSEDRKTYSFMLRKDVKDSKGNTLTAKDWVRTLQNLFVAGTTHTSFTESVGSSENIYSSDEYTLVVKLKTVWPTFLYRLTTPEFILMSPQQELKTLSLQNFTTSTGAYYIEMASPEQVVLKANRFHMNYSKDQAQKVVLMRAPENLRELVLRYQKDEIDFSLYPVFPFGEGFAEVEALKEEHKVVVAETQLQSIGWMIPNPNSAFFASKKNRLAFLSSWQNLPMPELNTFISRRTHQFIPPGFVGYDPDLESNPIPAESDENLPKTLKGIMTPVAKDSNIDKVLMPYFTKNGVDVSFETVPYDRIDKEMKVRSNDIYLGTMGMNVRDLSGSMMNIFGSKVSVQSDIQDIDGTIRTQLRDIISEEDVHQRHVKMMKLQRHVLELGLVVPLMVCEPNLLMYSSNWQLPKKYNRKDKFELRMFRRVL